MNTIKRRRLKAKRTPWAKTTSGRRAHARANAMRAMVMAQCNASSRNIIASIRKGGKPIAVAEVVLATIKAAAQVPVYGAKTV